MSSPATPARFAPHAPYLELLAAHHPGPSDGPRTVWTLTRRGKREAARNLHVILAVFKQPDATTPEAAEPESEEPEATP
jgi:hypothetical protein